MTFKILSLLAGGVFVASLSSAAMPAKKTAAAGGKPPTVAEAKAFLEEAESRLLALATDAGRAAWVQSTFITEDTEILAAQANERSIAASVAYAKKATRFDGLKLPADLARKMKLLKLSLITAAMEGAYGKGKYCPPGKDKCLDLEDITRIMATSRDPAELLDVWRGWHAIAPPLRR